MVKNKSAIVISEQELLKYQEHIIANFLDHKYGIKKCELLFKLAGEYQYNNKTLDFIVDRLFDNKCVEVEKTGLLKSRWLLFRSPREKKDVTLPNPCSFRAL